jgi:hypothetical protein
MKVFESPITHIYFVGLEMFSWILRIEVGLSAYNGAKFNVGLAICMTQPLLIG